MSDQLVRAISKDGFVKAVAVSTRELTERAHAQREKEAQEPQSNYRQRKKAQT